MFKASRQPRFSLRIKAIASIAFLLLMFFATFLFYTVDSHHLMVEQLMQRCYDSYAHILARTVEHIFQEDRPDLIGLYLEHTIEDPAIQYVVLEDDTGAPLYVIGAPVPAERGHDAATEDPDSDSPKDAHIHEIGSPDGFFHTAGHLFEITKPVTLAGNKKGVLRLGLSTAEMNQAVAKISYESIWLIILVTMVGGTLVLLVDRRIKRILQGLITTTEEMATGDLTKRVRINTGDAMEKLGNSFNIMAQRLQDREQELQRHRDRLEMLVQDRTAELESERSRMQAILDHVPSALVLLDPACRIQTASAAFSSVMGTSVSSVVGKECCAEMCSSRFHDHCLPKLVRQHGTIQSGTFTFYDDGRDKTVELTALPIMEDHQLTGILQIITDVTERHRLQERLIRAEKLAATGELAAVIAHEFRNTLTSVRVLLQLQCEQEPPDSEKTADLATVLEALGRMERLVDDLLRFARPAPLDRSQVDINEILESGLSMMRPRALDHGIVIHQKLRALPELLGDANQLREVFINLLLNAIQALPDGGEITVESNIEVLAETIHDDFAESPVGDPAEHAVQIKSLTFSPGSEVASVLIRDNGSGIDAAHLNRIFDPFYTTKTKGTGLGLALVKRVVNAHGGLITVESQLGTGTVFRIILPLQKDD